MARAPFPLPALLVFALLAGCAPSPEAAAPDEAPARPASDTVRTDWGRLFDAYGARGTFVLLDVPSGRVARYDPARAAERFIPASTFKVYNSLVALETGVIAANVDSVQFRWDGVDRGNAGWNEDQSLRTALRRSAVWVYQGIARRVGEGGYRAAFVREPYGNGDPAGGVDRFWLDGALRISALEQVTFLDRLRRGDLAFRPEVQAAVRDVLLLEEGDGYRLYAKTGWADRPEGDLGWLVGWVERGEDVSVFALNVEPLPGSDFDMASGRMAIARTVLSAEGLLPP
jgi:beta-lactamase class D